MIRVVWYDVFFPIETCSQCSFVRNMALLRISGHLGVHATRRTDQHCDSGTARRIATGTKSSQIIFWNIEELSQFRH